MAWTSNVIAATAAKRSMGLKRQTARGGNGAAISKSTANPNKIQIAFTAIKSFLAIVMTTKKEHNPS